MERGVHAGRAHAEPRAERAAGGSGEESETRQGARSRYGPGQERALSGREGLDCNRRGHLGRGDRRGEEERGRTQASGGSACRRSRHLRFREGTVGPDCFVLHARLARPVADRRTNEDLRGAAARWSPGDRRLRQAAAARRLEHRGACQRLWPAADSEKRSCHCQRRLGQGEQEPHHPVRCPEGQFEQLFTPAVGGRSLEGGSHPSTKR